MINDLLILNDRKQSFKNPVHLKSFSIGHQQIQMFQAIDLNVIC